MRCTKEDERRLKELQKMQMEEKKSIERDEQHVEMMWHHVLMDDYNRKVRLIFVRKKSYIVCLTSPLEDKWCALSIKVFESYFCEIDSYVTCSKIFTIG